MKTSFFTNIVRGTSVICALLLFIAVLQAPQDYYWMLRIIIFFGAILVVIKNGSQKYWIFIFTVIAALFNPILPVYLYKKILWMPIDILAGMVFLIEVIINRPKKRIQVVSEKEEKQYTRDKIY